MNPLTNIIPASARRYVYALYALGTLILSCLALADVTALGGLALVKCVGIWGLIGTAVGATAASNTPAPTARAKGEAGAADVSLALLVVVLLVVVLLLFGVRIR